MDKRSKEYKDLKDSYIFEWNRYTQDKDQSSLSYLKNIEEALCGVGMKSIFMEWRKS